MTVRAIKPAKQPARSCSCGGRSTVVETRGQDTSEVWRCRKCQTCGARWWTEEVRQ